MTEFDPGQFHLLRPLWLLGIVPVAFAAWRYLRRRGQSSGWSSKIDPALLDVLLETGSQRRNGLSVALLTVGLIAATIALSGPTFARLPQPVEQRTDALVVVLDLSLSMLVADTPPSRIVRARHKIADLLNLHTEGFVGLVAYAGDAHIVAPLTDDRRTVTNLLNALSPEMMPVLGSRPGDAITLARELLENAGRQQGRIIMFTDGIERISDVTRFAARNLPISILGIGTPRGGAIPLDFADQPGQVLRDDQGQPVMARLDTDRLRAVADLVHGRFSELAVGDADLRYLLATPLPGPQETVDIERQFDAWADVGYWIALALLPLALLAFRRGALVCLVCLVLSAPPADASWWDDLWQRADQQGIRALQSGEPERAASLFDNPQWRGVANYRSGLYEKADRAFSTDPSATGAFNRGNALAHQGDMAGAIAAYDDALALQPEHQDARFNKDLLEQQQASEQESSGSREDQPRDPEQDSTQSPQQQPQSEGTPGQPDSEAEQPSDSEPDSETDSDTEGGTEEQRLAEQAEKESRDELDDAVEQWLRRVPDDPGGLLRRKFQFETNQRRRRGEYGSRQEDQIW